MAGSEHIKSLRLYLGNCITQESTSLVKLDAAGRLQPEQMAALVNTHFGERNTDK